MPRRRDGEATREAPIESAPLRAYTAAIPLTA